MFIRKLKQFIKFILFIITDFLVKKNSKIKPKTILLIRLDAIGDYVLFRNFIEILKHEYKNYEITLVGNIAWKSIAEEFDSKYIKNFIWIDKKKFTINPFYRYKKLKEITNHGYEIIINPIYSRTFLDDNIVYLVNAIEKIGSSGSLNNMEKWQKKISDKYYTQLIFAKDEIMFEFYRNKEFFENLFKKKLNIKKPTIKLKEKRLNFQLPKRYAVLFIGASISLRKWSVEKFVEIGKFLQKEYNYEIIVCGGPGDLEDAQKFKKLSNYDYIDLVGKTSLVEFLYVLKKSELLISNETSAPHFAVALEVKNIFVVSNGNHFGRFTPYPKEIWQGYYPIYHPEIEKNLTNYKKLSNSYGYSSKLNINEISIDMLKNKIKNFLK